MNKTVRQYLNEIGERLPFGVENRERFLSDMEAAITENADPADISYLTLVKDFGDPGEITDDFLDMQDLRKYLK